MDLERAYANFSVKRAAFPKFKKPASATAPATPTRSRSHSIRRIGCIFLPKLGWMRPRFSHELLGKVCNDTVSLNVGK